jgi:hypothetical protein
VETPTAPVSMRMTFDSDQPTLRGHGPPDLTPNMNMCHSHGLNGSTGPLVDLLSRMPTSSSAGLATSTQFPLKALKGSFLQAGRRLRLAC